MTISYVITWRLVFTSDGVEVVIRSVELYDLGKTALWSFWFRLLIRRLRSSKNWVVGVASRSGRTKPITKRGNVHCDWFILPLLLPTPTIWFSLDHKRNVSDGVISGVGRKWKRSDSSDSDSVALMTLLTTAIFDFHWIINVKTSVYVACIMVEVYWCITSSKPKTSVLSPSTRKWEAGVFKNLHSGEKKWPFSVTVFTGYVMPCHVGQTEEKYSFSNKNGYMWRGA